MFPQRLAVSLRIIYQCFPHNSRKVRKAFTAVHKISSCYRCISTYFNLYSFCKAGRKVCVFGCFIIISRARWFTVYMFESDATFDIRTQTALAINCFTVCIPGYITVCTIYKMSGHSLSVNKDRSAPYEYLYTLIKNGHEFCKLLLKRTQMSNDVVK